MKAAQIFLISAAAGIISGCAGTQQASTGNSYDDVYFASNEKKNSVSSPSTATTPSDYSSKQSSDGQSDNSRFEYSEPDKSTSESRTGEDGNTYVTNNYYYDNDDYYDYAYSARLRRFYNPVGWGYYDSYYTNSYWYDYNPSSWGLSIYLGYNWWAPSYAYYSPFTWGFSFNYGYPSYGWCGNYWHNWYSPWYSSFYSYNNYWNGYYQGYWNGYYNGLYSSYNNPYYYNGYDYNSYNHPVQYTGPFSGNLLHRKNSPRPNVGQLYSSTLPDRPKTPIISPVSAESAPVRSETIKSNPVRGNTVKQNAESSPGQYTSDPRPKNPRSNNAETNPANPRGNTIKNDAPIKNNASEQVKPSRNDELNNYNSQPDPRPRFDYIESEKNDAKPNKQNDSYSKPVRDKSYEMPEPKNYEPSPRPKNNNHKPRENNSKPEIKFSPPKNDSYSKPQENRSFSKPSQPVQQKQERKNSSSRER